MLFSSTGVKVLFWISMPIKLLDYELWWLLVCNDYDFPIMFLVMGYYICVSCRTYCTIIYAY